MKDVADIHSRRPETAQEAVAEALAVPEELWDALGFLSPGAGAQATLVDLIRRRDEIFERRG